MAEPLPRSALRGLLEAIAQLQGLTLPWSALDRVLLPARVPGYRAQDLDLLAATGQIVWSGRESPRNT